MKPFTSISTPKPYERLTDFQQNTLACRSYFIPAATLGEARTFTNATRRENSSRFTLLNGQWQFRYVTSPCLLSQKDIEGTAEGYTNMPVPSCWQCHGYEQPFYVNNDFTMPADPPHVPSANPVGVYRRTVRVQKSDDRQYILSFLGVASSVHVFVNGQEAGYAQGSHNMHEFDISALLHSGDNLLTVLVYKWCSGSYLESQDMFRYNGIFRDVYLTERPLCHIDDVQFDYDFTSLADFACRLHVQAPQNARIRALLLDDSGLEKARCEGTANTTCTFTVHNPALWNAETPYCYTLYVSLLDEGGNETECVQQLVGFRTVGYKGAFTVNGVPVTLKGVNHHDSYPGTGYTMTDEQIRRDLQIIKNELNMNTVRTSHYPAPPLLMELCAQMGLYVIDEADLESYGSLNMKETIDYFGTHSEFAPMFIDRMQKLYHRDKNCPAVIMWSMGNEAGIGENFDRSYEYLKSVSPQLPVQYETCFRNYAYGEQKGYDIVSVMYPSLEQIAEWLGKDDDRPFYMCEYAHSMGNGPGGLEEYMQAIYDHPRFAGGCIWEFCDHAVPHKSADGKTYYTYGGDHGEYVHDSNFCCDGLVLPDRTLSVSALAVKNAYRPIVAKRQGERLTLRNTNSFVGSDAYRLTLRVLHDGKEVCAMPIAQTIPPLGETTISLPDCCAEGDDVTVQVITELDGREIGFDDIPFACPYADGCATLSGAKPETNASAAIEPPQTQAPVLVSQTAQEILFTCGKATARFDTYLNTFTSYCIDGTELFSKHPLNSGYGRYAQNVAGFVPNIWRAPTDNDMKIREEWEKQLLNTMWVSFYTADYTPVSDGDKKFEIRLQGIFTPPKFSVKFGLSIQYTVRDNLQIDCTYTLTPLEEDIPYLPRFGIRADINPNLRQAVWFGKGPEQSYNDFALQAKTGIFEAASSAMSDYSFIRPQETGNRSNVRWFSLLDSRGKGVRFSCRETFLNFSVSPYSLENVTNAKHTTDLLADGNLHLFVDGFMSGLGSNSCGWLPLPVYQTVAKKDCPLAFTFTLSPLGL